CTKPAQLRDGSPPSGEGEVDGPLLTGAALDIACLAVVEAPSFDVVPAFRHVAQKEAPSVAPLGSAVEERNTPGGASDQQAAEPLRRLGDLCLRAAGARRLRARGRGA